MVWHGIKPGLTTPLDLFCLAPVQSRDNTAIGFIYTFVSVFCFVFMCSFSCFGCFGYFSFQLHSFQLQFCTSFNFLPGSNSAVELYNVYIRISALIFSVIFLGYF